MIRISMILQLAIWLSSCSASVTPGELAGTYEAKFEFGAERLSLEPDGNYKQNLTLANSGEAISHSGRWEYSQSRSLVIVHDPLMFDDNFGKLNPKYRTPVDGSWNLNVAKGIHSLTLTWNDDVGVVPGTTLFLPRRDGNSAQ